MEKKKTFFRKLSIFKNPIIIEYKLRVNIWFATARHIKQRTPGLLIRIIRSIEVLKDQKIYRGLNNHPTKTPNLRRVNDGRAQKASIDTTI